MNERRQDINRVCRWAMIFLACTALFAVMGGFSEPPQRDEGSAAHIFQLSVAALAPVILLFLATADWRRPLRNAGPLAFSAMALFIAFGALYYREHFR